MSNRRITTVLLSLTLLVAGPAFAGTTFTFPLTGLQETPPVATSHFGQCVAILSADESTLDIQCTHTIPDSIGAHIHVGATGEPGPIVFDLGDPSSPIHATWAIPPGRVAELLVGDLYVNVHTPAHPPGEIRGQMWPDKRLGERLMVFPLEGEQETPPVDTEFSGRCIATLDAGSRLSLTCVHDIPETTAAHIHIGPRGDPGPIDIGLGDGMSPIRGQFQLNAFQLQFLLAGNYYVNVHTAAHPPGEIRGQMDTCFEDRNTLCLNERRFAVFADWEVPPDHPVFTSGSGVAMPLTDDSGAYWFFFPDNLELKVKVLDGCPVNNHFWVFAAGLTDVKVTLTVVDTVTGEEREYTNDLGTAFQPIQDTSAFATCP
jgi:hypothetical protein